MKNILTILFCVIGFLSLHAWGPNGHRIVAQICEWRLNDEAKTEIERILGTTYLAEIGTWPDYIRSEKGWKFAESWHYTTVHPNQTIEDVQMFYSKDSTINDAMEAIQLMRDILNDDPEAIALLEGLMKKNHARPLNNSTKATALAFLVHLVGDIHMPLHVGKNKDRGGNKISVMFFRKKPTYIQYGIQRSSNMSS